MPEGDTVFRLAARLRAAAQSRPIAEGELRSGPAAGTRLGGARIEGFDTHGKHLLLRLSSGDTLHTHLRMQGSWTITGAGRRVPRDVDERVRVRLRLADGRTLWGVDLPVVELLPTGRESDAVGHLGPDPLRDDWDAEAAAVRLRRVPARPLAAAILDQRNVAGFGNLWANELAFLRGHHPHTPMASVDADALVALGARALRLSATRPGMLQVTTGDARRGRSHWVAGRAGRPCLRCGTTIRVLAERPGDPERRRTWWCPRCQPREKGYAAPSGDASR